MNLNPIIIQVDMHKSFKYVTRQYFLINFKVSFSHNVSNTFFPLFAPFLKINVFQEIEEGPDIFE